MSQIKVVLGIDVGATNTKYGLVDHEGQCHFQDSISTYATETPAQLFKMIFDTIDGFIHKQGKYKLTGVGVGAPNANYYRGTIENPVNISGWGIVNVVELVKQHLNLPGAITNDANAAALGELEFGNAQGVKHFIEITLGTGVGSGIVVAGEIVHGHTGFAGELGHVVIEKNGRQCGCGRQGCLETYTSATGLVRNVLELMAERINDSKLRKIAPAQLTAKRVYQMAQDGDELALAAFDITGKYLGEAMADVIAAFSPEAIILFGGLATAGDLIFKPVKKYMDAAVLSIYKHKVKLLPSGLPASEAAILGAAGLIWHELKR